MLITGCVFVWEEKDFAAMLNDPAIGNHPDASVDLQLPESYTSAVLHGLSEVMIDDTLPFTYKLTL